MYRDLCSSRVRFRLLTVFLILAAMLVFSTCAVNALTATGKVDSKGGAVMRMTASSKGAKVAKLKNNAKVTILKEVFTSKTSTRKKKKWYLVSAKGTTGYIRADLVDHVKYTKTKVRTTEALNYRAGAGTSMKKKGTFKKGTVLTAVLDAAPKGDSTTWVKVKKGSSYVYVSGSFVQDASAPLAASASAVTASVVGGIPWAPAPDYSIPLGFSLSDVTAPDITYTRVPFTLKGIVSATRVIDSAEVGIINSTGNWSARVTASVSSTQFNVATVDSQIKFGTLPIGVYKYVINVWVEGVCYTQVDKVFEVRQATMPSLLTQTALALAWPAGTDSSKYDYPGGSATNAFNEAINRVYPDRSSWGEAPRKGASCDVFVGTVVRASGYDPEFPRGWDEQWAYLPTSERWKQISYSGNEADLQTGDVIVYKKSGGGVHSCMYVVIDGQGCIAEASLKNNYGHINTSISKIQDFSKIKEIRVYRAVC